MCECECECLSFQSVITTVMISNESHSHSHTHSLSLVRYGVPIPCTPAARLRWDELTCNREGGNGSEIYEDCDITPPGTSSPCLPETNLFPEKENVSQIFGWRWTNIHWLHLGEPKNPPIHCRKSKTCNNVECQRDIFFMEVKYFPIIQEENRQKVLLFLWNVHKPTKKPVWLTNHRRPC